MTTAIKTVRSRKQPSRQASPGAPISEGFDWPLAYDAEQLLRRRVEAFLDSSTLARRLAQRMREETGTDFFEWIDHLVLAPTEEPALREAGFLRDARVETPDGEQVYAHPRATLPRLMLHRGQRPRPSVIALRPEFIGDFIARHHLAGEPEGEPFSRYRRVVVTEEKGTQLEAVERRAYRGFVTAPLKSGELSALIKARELWQTRPRGLADDRQGFRVANQVLDRVLALVGRDLACQLFFEAERAYWESRNRAAQAQKQRQDRLGLGWGNHDHHTFRSSRRHFLDLMRVMERLGFERRERYYAGAQAGWGAQILEQPVEGVVVFADVDLLPEETEIDFSRAPLPPAPRLGTIGLWVGLHGESFLEAGMHHLEARFDFAIVREQLKALGIAGMPPFSDFAFLKQAFTEGDRWPVRRERAEDPRSQGLLLPWQADRLARR